MDLSRWQQFSITADEALNQHNRQQAQYLYEQALSEAQAQWALCNPVDDGDSFVDAATAVINTCLNIANCWRIQSVPDTELTYLQQAAQLVLDTFQQGYTDICQQMTGCLGMCKHALIDYMKRHPDPATAQLIPHLESTYWHDVLNAKKAVA